MDYTRLTDREEIQSHLEDELYLNIYGIGDLDDFFWPYTTWYGSRSNGRLSGVVLVYDGPEMPTVVALSGRDGVMAQLLESVQRELPEEFYAHLSPGLEGVLGGEFSISGGAAHHKMALTDTGIISRTDCTGVTALDLADLPELQTLYDESYPGNWFDPRMLQTGQYVGIRQAGKLVSAAGVHVFSPRFKVAALGNIVTHHDFRGRGLGTLVTAAACRSLLRTGARIGLNVQADNLPAIACYRGLGFEIVAPYGEYDVKRK